MERALWSGLLVLVWVASVTMLTVREFVLEAVVIVPFVVATMRTRRALNARRFEGAVTGNRQ